MRVIEPTEKQVFDSLRGDGCCHLGGIGCECFGSNLKSCLCSARTYLTRYEYTEDEIKEQRQQNEIFMADLDKALDELMEGGWEQQ